MLLEFIRRLSTVERVHKRSILVAFDMTAMLVALWAAFAVRLGQFLVPVDPLLIALMAIAVGIGIVGLERLGIYRFVLRFFDLATVSRIFLGAAVAAGAWALLVYFSQATMVVGGKVIQVPRSIGLIYCGYLFFLLFMGRYLMAAILATAQSGGEMRRSPAKKKNVLIYGANAAGVSLAESVRQNPAYRMVGFVEDDPALSGQMAVGLPIYRPGRLAELIRDNEVSEVFLAMPKATRSQRLAAISLLKNMDVQVKTVPSPEEIVSGRLSISDVRPIDVNDLLRREAVEPLSGLIDEAIAGHTILVTGAGGSIGSEICRQVVRGRPAKLVLLDHSEFALFSIEQQLIELLASDDSAERPAVVPVIGSLLDQALVIGVLRDHAVDTIFHAAAYKHVPLLEDNEVVGTQNNVLGTWLLARAAIEARVVRFTMISTDKAVRPESVMGASKRVAELIVQALADEGDHHTRFGIVRFGNVLDSSGSVVQRFREQISRGGPVTVTHPDITRFFMSIPEATQLVVQASAMSDHGEVFVLDMGEPIRIADLARDMISLSGLTVREGDNPAGDIEVTYIGLRPGEKLFEELFVDPGAQPTGHPRIMMAKERFLSLGELQPHIANLQAAIDAGNRAQVRACLQDVIRLDHSQDPALSPSLQVSPAAVDG